MLTELISASYKIRHFDLLFCALSGIPGHFKRKHFGNTTDVAYWTNVYIWFKVNFPGAVVYVVVRKRKRKQK